MHDDRSPDEFRELTEAAERIAEQVSGPAADEVDRDARFPRETLAALREAKLLSAAVPRDLGGSEAPVRVLVQLCTALARRCSSSAMVLAMHYIKVLSLVRHRGQVVELHEYLRRLVQEQRLIASVTSEVGPSGDMRQSVAAVERVGGAFTLTKRATTISYGQHADDLLITARRDAQAAANDQVLVLAPRGTFALENIGSWNTLGMRGTCSPGATVVVKGDAWQIVPEAFGDIATQTMVPTSHLLWSGCWLGIATDAVNKARALLRDKARATPGSVPRVAQRVAQLGARLQLMRHEVTSLADEYDAKVEARDVDGLASLGFVLRINNLKLSASQMVTEIVAEALGICGIAAYKNDSPASLGRHLRDAHSAALMINNDRLIDTNAALLSVHKGL